MAKISSNIFTAALSVAACGGGEEAPPSGSINVALEHRYEHSSSLSEIMGRLRAIYLESAIPLGGHRLRVYVMLRAEGCESPAGVLFEVTAEELIVAYDFDAEPGCAEILRGQTRLHANILAATTHADA